MDPGDAEIRIAADDAHGVGVILELLRVLRDEPRQAPLAAIFTDGEEAGLLGARLLPEHPRFAELGVALNVEARGTTGAGRMFETSDGNAALVAAYAAAPRPSVFNPHSVIARPTHRPAREYSHGCAPATGFVQCVQPIVG